ncbi:MAG: glycosyltransferase family 9 protein [Alphaproteobacteria bacterium]|nr:glycosyltransferase family 9 protein [Alphaproteobacteria bacterium]
MRTLVVRLGALGDAVLTLPALAHLLARGDEVTVLGLPASWAFLARHDRLRIEDADGPRSRGIFSGAASEAASGFERAIVMLGAASVAEALTRAGIATLHVPPLKPGERGEHAALRLLRGVGGSSIDAEAVRRLIAPDPGGEEYDLVLHPGSAGIAKRWPAERFAALARRFRSPLILLGPAEAELAPVFDGLAVAQSWPLRQVVSLLAAAHGFVGNDSGISHLASWLCPMLALFGPTDSVVWAPVGPHAKVLAAAHGDLSRLTVDAVSAHLPA